MVKKGFLKKIGCILISTSIVLTGWTFLCSSTSEAEGTYSGTTYTITDGNLALGDLVDYMNEVVTITSSSDTTVEDSAAAGLSTLETFKVSGNVSVAADAFNGDSALTSFSCTTMTNAKASSFNGCTGIVFSISGQTVGSGYYIYDKALYNGTTLVYVPNKVGSSFTVKEGTTTIEAGAFDDTTVTELNFENKSAGKIVYIGSHSNWPESGSTINAYGATNDSYVVDYFSTKCLNAGTHTVNCDSSEPTEKYTVTITEVVGDDTYTLTYSDQKAGTVITPTARTGYSCSDTYTVTSEEDQSHTFTYTKDPDPTPTTITVTITEVAGETYTLTYTDKSEGDVISPTARDGYTCSDSYTVTSETTQAHTFTYTKNDDPTPTPTPTPDPGGGGGGGGGSSSGGSSSSSSSTTTTTTDTVSEEAQTTAKYHIIEGGGQIVDQNGGPVRIVCDGPVDKLAYILMDGNKIQSGNYTIESGSTILTLTKDYIASLSLGDHAVQFQYTDGYAITGLRITSSATRTTTTVTYRVSSDGSISSGHTRDSTPQTADGFDSRYLLCMGMFLLGAGAILISRQRKLEAILANREDEY